MEGYEVPAYVSNPCDFCYIMPDDSMNLAYISKGDLLCFREADSVEDGKIAAVVVDGAICIRKVYQMEGVKAILLRSCSSIGTPAPDGAYNADDVWIVGVLVESHHYFE